MSFKDYLLHGWKLCSIRPGFKGPTGQGAAGWQTREKAIEDPALGPALAGAGLLHAWSGTCALDIDNMAAAEKWLAERGIDLTELRSARDSVHIASGREGRDKLLYLLDTPLPSKKFAPYKQWSEKSQKEETYHAFELRCSNSNGESVQDVLPPTIHPNTGRAYEWAYGDDLLGDWRFPPAIPESLLGLWLAEVSSGPKAAGPQAPAGATPEHIRDALKDEDPSDYDNWIEIGATLHHETQASEDGLRIYDEWSRGSAKYEGYEACAAKWRSFRLDAKNPKTFGGLLRKRTAAVTDFPVSEPVAAPVPRSSAPAAVAHDLIGEPVEGPPADADWETVKQILEPRLVFVRSQDQYFDMASHGDGYLSDRGVRHIFCPHMPTITEVDEKGKPKSSKPDPVIFLQNSRSKQIADAVGLHPGGKRVYEEDRRVFVNRYYPQKIEPLAPTKWEEEVFLGLWNRLGDPIFSKWLMKFYAHAVQKPGVKMTSAPLIYSAEQGTGKNTFCKVVPSLLFGSRWVRTMSGTVLQSAFNDTVGDTWWLYLDELKAGTNKLERTVTTNRLKSWITDDQIEVHPKGLKPFDIRNRLQITATSNFDDALQLDNNDRRWAVCELPQPMSEQESTDIYHFLKSARAPGVLRHLFLSTSLVGFSPTARAPQTLAKVCMIRAGIGVWESTLIERMVRALPPFNRDIFQMQAVYEELAGRNGPPSTHAVRQLLTKSPFHCKQLPNGVQRLYAWRNFDKWAKLPESQRARYLETGIRPLHLKWSDEIPDNLMTMSSDGPLTPEPEVPIHDLL